MIYLKRFNEGINQGTIDHLRIFCEESLVYLIDSGFSVIVIPKEEDGKIVIALGNNGKRKYGGYSWNDIKYDYIAFLEFLKSKYEVLDRVVVRTWINPKGLNIDNEGCRVNFDHIQLRTYDQLLNDDDILNKFNFVEISIYVKFLGLSF
jgi:hypothetical protein